MKKLLEGFKNFIVRGNAVDLAVGVIIGAAFNAVVNGLVKDILTPLIGVIAKVPDMSNLVIEVNGSKLMYGDMLNVLISFFLVAFSVYFFVVLPMNALHAKIHRGPEAPATTKKCPECQSDIPAAAKRCAFCTQVIS